MNKKLVIVVVIIVLLALGFYIYNSSAKAGVSGNAVSVEWCNGADINRDGKVGIGDAVIVSENYNKKGCSIANLWCNGADINRDKKVSIGDLTIISENYDKSGCVSASVEKMVAYWKFDDGVGAVAYDLTGNGNQGSFEGGVSWTSDSKGGYALSFDGVDDRVNVVKTSSMDVTKKVTMEAWIKRSSDRNGTIFSRNGPFFIAVRDNKLYGGIHTDGGPEGWAHISGKSLLKVGRWYNVKIVYDGVSVKGYVNGVQEANVSKSGIMVVRSQQPWIGWGEPGQNQYFHGVIDELKVSGI